MGSIWGVNTLCYQWNAGLYALSTSRAGDRNEVFWWKLKAIYLNGWQKLGEQPLPKGELKSIFLAETWTKNVGQRRVIRYLRYIL